MITMYKRTVKNGAFHSEIELSNGRKIIELVTSSDNNGKCETIHLLAIEVLIDNKELGTKFIDGYDVSDSVRNNDMNEIIKFCDSIYF
ncbi:hypothetical protein [Bacillus bombysepticus]|uniref:hypothetical protein n=1 Tax=Bacillus bombysepticus TaxID=658666 RepID=UPI003018CBD9